MGNYNDIWCQLLQNFTIISLNTSLNFLFWPLQMLLVIVKLILTIVLYQNENNILNDFQLKANFNYNLFT